MNCVEVVQKAETEKTNEKIEKAVTDTARKPENKESIHEFIQQAQADIKVGDAEKSRKKPDAQIGER